MEGDLRQEKELGDSCKVGHGEPRSSTWGWVLEEWKDWMQDLGENCERSDSLDINGYKSEGLSKKVI